MKKKEILKTGGTIIAKSYSVNDKFYQGFYVIPKGQTERVKIHPKTFRSLCKKLLNKRLFVNGEQKDLSYNGYTDTDIFEVFYDLLGQKEFKIQYNVGSAKYALSFHDGIKMHEDGSKFFDLRIFTNKKDLTRFVKVLTEQGYKEV